MHFNACIVIARTTVKVALFFLLPPLFLFSMPTSFFFRMGKKKKRQTTRNMAGRLSKDIGD